jgi:hypothetical protein
MKADERAKLIEKNIRSVYSSLESHLAWMYRKSSEGKRFHKKCVTDYAEQIYNLTKLL